jgi:hypothetical protein
MHLHSICIGIYVWYIYTELVDYNTYIDPTAEEENMFESEEQ